MMEDMWAYRRYLEHNIVNFVTNSAIEDFTWTHENKGQDSDADREEEDG